MTIAMTAGYSEETEGARICLERSFDLIDRALADAPVSDHFSFVDYGCADGGTSLGLYRRVLGEAERRRLPATLHLSDLPSNDFSALARATAYLTSGPDAHVHLVPRSFFEPVTPPGTVHLGFTATAMHWLSRLPEPLTRHTHANAAPDEAARARFADAAARDWAHLLALRSQELAPGGHLVAVNLARDTSGRYLGHNLRDRNMHDVLHTLWRGLLEEGTIATAEYERGTFQNYYRSEEELTSPVRGSSRRAGSDEGGSTSSASDDSVGLTLVSSRIEHIPCPYRARFDADGDAARFASGLMRTIRSWSRHTFEAALAGRTDSSVAPVVDRLYTRLEDTIRAEPTSFSMDYIESYLHFVKEA